MVYMPAAGREYMLPKYMAGRPVIAAVRVHAAPVYDGRTGHSGGLQLNGVHAGG